MKYRVRLISSTRYDTSAPLGAHVLRVKPIESAQQRVFSFSVELEPTPADVLKGVDWFGNVTQAFIIDKPHESFVFRALAEVETTAHALDATSPSPPWETVRALAWQSADASTWSPAHFLFPSRIVAIDDAITDYAESSFPPGRPILTALDDLMRRIHRDFIYDVDATDVTTTPSAAFAAKRGVCQDFAQVMIAGLRGLGLPAGYVSGFLRTLPPPGKPRLEGADATHAWVCAWCGPELGWVDFDPTNALIPGDSHITIGAGRDYADVAPEVGVIVTYGKQALEVAVDVTPLG
jgi:transglutaminase-like putative cysteine protease